VPLRHVSLKQQKTNNTCSENIAKQNKHKARVAKARAGKENFSKSSGGAPGINTRTQVHSRALLQVIYISGDVPACLNPSPVAERGANARPGEAAEGSESANPGAPLWEEYAPGTAADEFARVK